MSDREPLDCEVVFFEDSRDDLAARGFTEFEIRTILSFRERLKRKLPDAARAVFEKDLVDVRNYGDGGTVEFVFRNNAGEATSLFRDGRRESDTRGDYFDGPPGDRASSNVEIPPAVFDALVVTLVNRLTRIESERLG